MYSWRQRWKYDVRMRFLKQKEKWSNRSVGNCEECFKNDDGLAIENPADAGKDSIPKVEADHKFYNVSAVKTEHFTAPPKPYSEDTACSYGDRWK